MAIFIFYLDCYFYALISSQIWIEEVMQSKPNLHMLPKWEVISVPSLEQLRKKDCPNSWSARLSQSQDVDGQGLGYTSRHSGCNTTIQQFLCCILRRALTSLVLSYKNRPLWLSTKIFSTSLCAANHRWRLVLLSSSEWRYQNFDRNRYWDFYSDTKFSKTENLKKIGKSFETEMSISVVKFSASGCGVGWGREPSIATQIKTAATQTYVSTLNP